MKKVKVIILQGTVCKYREPLFNLLSQRYDLTIGYTTKTEYTPVNHTIEKISFIKVFSLFLPTLSFINCVNKYDVVIIMPDIHYLNYCILPFLPLKAKIISWSIGMRASYKLKYNIKRQKEFLDYLFLSILKKCDANIFYYGHPIVFWGKLLYNHNTFTAFNTVKVLESNSFSKKRNTILFLGSLIKGKGVLMLIELFNELLKDDSEFSLNLKIIGGGPLEQKINNYIKTEKLSNNIQMCGPIYDESLLKDHFSSVLFCISPNQAGLSVLKSMGYGVPFVTSFDAITGGEKYAIKDGLNGLFYNTRNELKDILLNASNDLDRFLKMGINAKKYYTKNATIDLMSNGFISAIEYVLSKK